MSKLSFCITTFFACISINLAAQITMPSFGNGIQFLSKDSSVYLNTSARFQTLMTNNWNLKEDKISDLTDHQSNFLIRRARLKFKGWALSPKLTYNIELAFSNQDNGGGNSTQFSNAANILLNSFVEWNFHKGFSIWAGQGKLPGNRERIISSGDMQFVDRSALNSTFNIDRDLGIMLKHNHQLGNQFILRETFSLTKGEGKNVTASNIGGADYTFKIEALPFGLFKQNGDYVGGAIARESSPKLAIAVAYDINVKAGRTRGQRGSFLLDENNNSVGKNLNSFFADAMFKYQGFSVMAEYVIRKTSDNDPVLYSKEDIILGIYTTGSASNLAIGYLLKNNWEIATRWTGVYPQEQVGNDENQFTLGLSKYIVGHKLKVQTDVTYRSVKAIDDQLIFRLQFDFHL